MNKMIPNHFHCFCCNKPLTPDYDNPEEDDRLTTVAYGLFFQAHGNYGTTVFDPSPKDKEDFVEIVICDWCLIEHAQYGRIFNKDRTTRPLADFTKDHPGPDINIGGNDYTINKNIDLNSLLNFILKEWPDSYFQDANQTQFYKLKYYNKSLEKDVKEFFVYINKSKAKKWNEEGYTIENRNSMVHFLKGPDSFTVVYDDETDFIKKLKEFLKIYD